MAWGIKSLYFKDIALDYTKKSFADFTGLYNFVYLVDSFYLFIYS